MNENYSKPGTGQPPGFPIVFPVAKDCHAETVGNALAKKLRYENIANRLKGFWLDYSHGETAEHKRYCQAFVTSCYFMVQYARNSRKDIIIAKNGNGQLLIKLNEE